MRTTSPCPSARQIARIAGLAAALAAAAIGAGCGDGGEDDNGPYFAVEGSPSSSGPVRAVCIEGIEYIDPATLKGQQIAANLVAYYGFVGRYTAWGGAGEDCRGRFSNLQVVLSVSDYNNVILPWVQSHGGGPSPGPAPAPGPAPSPAPKPAPTPAPTPPPITPRACGETSGSGINGLQLYGAAAYQNLPSVASSSGLFSFDPGQVSFANPLLTPSSITGSLRSSLWAVAGSFNGGTINGYVVARYAIRFTDGTTQLSNGESADLVAQTLNASTPPRGSYCMVATLEEYNPASCPTSGDGYCLVDWQQFPSSAQFQ